MDVVMYIFVNRGLGMTAGKVAAQASHAAVEAYRVNSCGSDKQLALIPRWYEGGHYTKLIMLAESTEHLLNIKRYLEERGLTTKLIIDEGKTEVAPHSPTALGVELVDRHDPKIHATFSSFQTYREKIRATIEIDR